METVIAFSVILLAGIALAYHIGYHAGWESACDMAWLFMTRPEELKDQLSDETAAQLAEVQRAVREARRADQLGKD